MTILCAPANLHPVTRRCLGNLTQKVDLVPIDPDDRYAYWRAIRERWNGDNDLLIIEQDMEFDTEMVTDILLCDKQWCARGYKISTARNTGCLGFTKFGSELMAMLKPEILEGAMRACDLCHGEYWHLDFHLTETARVAGFWCHDHGDVEHLHEYMPLNSLMKVEGMTSYQLRAKVTEYMKDNGWQGPDKYQSHQHNDDCHCIWAE